MTKKALMAVADGSEETETVATVDVLRRAEFEVVLASITGKLEVKLSHGIKLIADKLIEDVKDQDFDIIIAPGGHDGSVAMSKHHGLLDMFKKQRDAKKWFGGICAAPSLVLAQNGLLTSISKATCYPMPDLVKNLGDKYVKQSTVVSENCITSTGPATAIEFGLTIAKQVGGDKAHDKVKKELAL